MDEVSSSVSFDPIGDRVQRAGHRSEPTIENGAAEPIRASESLRIALVKTIGSEETQTALVSGPFAGSISRDLNR
ncbi:hypothetical protein [Natronococcus wangiae]|uniref:hypothetical protein n=1 Tax=Natronococcus wangiae TaxID=3068275 RepID=UPI00273E556C|nr:hypothetical protein [Natronococcus sp. AD5]